MRFSRTNISTIPGDQFDRGVLRYSATARRMCASLDKRQTQAISAIKQANQVVSRNRERRQLK
jgi:hypothetical protein